MLTLGLPKLTKIRTIVEIEVMDNRALEITFEEVLALTSASPTTRLQGFFPTGESCSKTLFSTICYVQFIALLAMVSKCFRFTISNNNGVRSFVTFPTFFKKIYRTTLYCRFNILRSLVRWINTFLQLLPKEQVEVRFFSFCGDATNSSIYRAH